MQDLKLKQLTWFWAGGALDARGAEWLLPAITPARCTKMYWPLGAELVLPLATLLALLLFELSLLFKMCWYVVCCCCCCCCGCCCCCCCKEKWLFKLVQDTFNSTVGKSSYLLLILRRKYMTNEHWWWLTLNKCSFLWECDAWRTICCLKEGKSWFSYFFFHSRNFCVVHQHTLITTLLASLAVVCSSGNFLMIFVTVVPCAVAELVTCTFFASIDGGGRSCAFNWCRFGLFCITARQIS